MKNLNDIKTALSTPTYQAKYGFSESMGTPEGIQEQFDNATEFPVPISYIDLGVYEEKPATEIITLLLDEDGDVVDRPESRHYLA